MWENHRAIANNNMDQRHPCNSLFEEFSFDIKALLIIKKIQNHYQGSSN